MLQLFYVCILVHSFLFECSMHMFYSDNCQCLSLVSCLKLCFFYVSTFTVLWANKLSIDWLTDFLLVFRCNYIPILPAALRAAQSAGYLIYSEADFEDFRPAGAKRCTDGVKFGTEEGTEGPPCQISPPSVQR